MGWGDIQKPIWRLIACSAAVFAITALRFSIHIDDGRLLTAGLNLFLVVVLAASIQWGTRYGIFLSFLSALAFSRSLPPVGHFHFSDPRVWTLLTACLITGIVAGQLSGRARKEALNARRSEKELRDVIETIPAIAWSALPDGSNVFANSRWTEYTGLPVEQTAGSGWQATIHPEDLQRHLERWRASLATGEPFEVEVRMRRADGQYRWHYVHGVPLRDGQGKISKWYGISTDVEDRRQAQDAVRRSEAYLAEAQRLTHTGSWGFNPNTDKMVYWSEETFRIFGLDPREGPPSIEAYRQRIHPEDRERARRLRIQTFTEKSEYKQEYRILLPDGTVRYVHVIGHPTLDHNGEVLEYVGTMVDVTERKRSEGALRRSETYLAEAQRLSKTGSWAWDPNSDKILYWSDETFRIFGLNPSESPLSIESFRRRTHPEDRERINRLRTQAFAEKSDYDSEYRLLFPDGTVKYVHVIGHPALDDNGEVLEYVGTVVDVTDRKRAEEERERLRQMEADLARFNRVSIMGELAASLAHEIKQPIAAAVLDAGTCQQWLAHDDPDVEEARQSASRMIQDVTRASEIIGRVRSLYKKGEPQRELIDMNQIIREMIDLLRGETQRHSISIHSDLAEELPHISADRVQLQQVFMNLMLNAVDAMKESGGTGKLTIKSQFDPGKQLLISVIDTGPGLPPGQADKIFNAFFTTKAQGTGMGLSISRSIIESHGGRLWVIADSEQGTTFQFTIPRAA